MAKVTVDGTDFRVPLYGGQKNYKKYKSHKFQAPGLRYEVGIGIQAGDIVHILGPFPAGKWNDIAIFRKGMKKKLELGLEVVEADKGYRGEPFFVELPEMDGGAGKRQIKAKSRARGRHETCNKRFKQWKSLSDRFRHSEEQHGFVFKAIATLEQIGIRTGMGLYDIEYKTMMSPERKKNFALVRKKLATGELRRLN